MRLNDNNDNNNNIIIKKSKHIFIYIYKYMCICIDRWTEFWNSLSTTIWSMIFLLVPEDDISALLTCYILPGTKKDINANHFSLDKINNNFIIESIDHWLWCVLLTCCYVLQNVYVYIYIIYIYGCMFVIIFVTRIYLQHI